MRTSMGERGFSLIEVLIATAMLVVLAMGLAAGMGAAFMADSAARDAARSVNAARRVLEELQELEYHDVLAEDGTATVTGDGVAVKISAHESMVGMILVEVYAFRATTPRTAGELAAMTMAQVKQLPAFAGSPVRVITYRAGRE